VGVTSFPDVVTQLATRRRVGLDLLWQAFQTSDPVGARELDARARLAALLDAGGDEGRWVPSRSQDVTGTPPLPRFVTLPAPAAVGRPDPTAVSWRPQLSWAASERLSQRQFDMLVAVNTFLRTAEGRPVVPTAERALELFGDEKALDQQPGGKTLWRVGRLSFELLRCARPALPFVWEPGGTGTTLLIVENQATWHSARQVLREQGSSRIGPVAWGSGAQILTRIAYVADLPARPSKVEYFGDLDIRGLQIAADLSRTAARLSLPAVVPAQELYALLREAEPARADRGARPDEAVQLAAWLPGPLRSWAEELLTSGRRVAQEHAGYEQLSIASSWRRKAGDVAPHA
jgi:hypothetical protein